MKIKYYYAVYKNGLRNNEEPELLESFKSFPKAKKYCDRLKQQQGVHSYIVYLPNCDPDDFNMENQGEYEDFEVVYIS